MAKARKRVAATEVTPADVAKQKASALFSRLIEARHLLHIHGIISDAEATRAAKRTMKWAVAKSKEADKLPGGLTAILSPEGKR